jgi:hypothetical protein
MYYTQQRGKCCICGGNCNTVCVGCKRWYCVKTQDDKLRKMISDFIDRVEFMDGERPPSTLAINDVADDGTTKEFCVVDNGCYHIVHKEA